MANYLLSIDQGTTSSRAILFDKSGKIISLAQKEFTQIYPKPGFVEHNAEEIWLTQLEVTRRAMLKANAGTKDILSIGITNQRETVVVWDKHSGKPVHHALVWQDKRTNQRCAELKKSGLAEKIKAKTGLVVDAYFSATKIEWILNQYPSLRKKAESGELLTGTIDTWLIWNFTGGAVHATDVSNASRTMLFNIETLDWDQELLEIFNIPKALLPEIKMSADNFGKTMPGLLGGASIPINGVAGDQQAALYGQMCTEAGMAKNTYGTGCFLLKNTGYQKVSSEKGLLTTIAWGLDGKISYALEGSIFIAGAAVQWLRDGLGLVSKATETENLAMEVDDTNGVYVVPAFSGLGAPYWDMDAKGAIIGITRGVNNKHLIRATLESIAYQTKDVLDTMNAESGIELQSLRADGGASANNFLMQFQSDILNTPVERPLNVEATAWGAALFAATYLGIYKPGGKMTNEEIEMKRFKPDMQFKVREKLYADWQEAVARVRTT